MVQTAALRDPADSRLTLVFTNSGGNVIFSDQKFLRAMGEKASAILSGIPLRNVLIFDSPTESKLFEGMRQRTTIEHISMEYLANDGSIIKSDSTAIAAMDERGNFMGMDIILNDPSLPMNISAFRSHSDVIRGFVEKEMNSRDPNHPRTFTQSYLVAQFNTLQVLLARIGGPAARSVLENIANEAAKNMGMPIHMENGYLSFGRKDINIQVYKGLLQAVTGYAVDVLGKQTVKREMLLVDKFVSQGTLELLSQMDLRIFSEDQ